VKTTGKLNVKSAVARVADRFGLALPSDPEALEKSFTEPLKRNAFFLAFIPSLAFFRISVPTLNLRECHVDIPFSWRTQNPFKSIYFAAQSAAAELSTGALVLRAIAAHPSMSMLVVKMSAEFSKKAKSDVRFICRDGEAIHAAAVRALAGETVNVTATAIGQMADGTEVSRFTFEWALKIKS